MKKMQVTIDLIWVWLHRYISIFHKCPIIDTYSHPMHIQQFDTRISDRYLSDAPLLQLKS